VRSHPETGAAPLLLLGTTHDVALLEKPLKFGLRITAADPPSCFEISEPERGQEPMFQRDNVRQRVSEGALLVTPVLTWEQRRLRLGKASALQSRLALTAPDPVGPVKCEVEIFGIATQGDGSEEIEMLNLVELEHKGSVAELKHSIDDTALNRPHHVR
jgi:hypothetical protein